MTDNLSPKTATESNVSSYRNVFKATSLFGGVQVYLIIIQIIRSKIIAALLGPTGFGIQGLFTSATLLIRNLSSMGLSQSAVKDVSAAFGTGDKEKVSFLLSVVNKLVLCTGLLGLIIVVIFSPILSKTSFGNYEYILSFIFLSVTLLFDQLYDGKKVILQGTRELKKLAQVSAYSTTIALLITIPIYYILGIKGIVLALIANSILSFFIINKLSGDSRYQLPKVGLKNAISAGGNMMKMGLAMSFSGIFSTACAYILRSYINYVDGTVEVGLYMAGFVIINTYVGLVFSAITTDYYPRLASVSCDNLKMREVINTQGEIGIIILGPLLSLCILVLPLLIIILYTNEFLPACDFILLAAEGMIFRLISILPAFIFIVKGETKLYILNEFAIGVITIVLNIVGYKLGGLYGLGLSYTIGYLIYVALIYYFTHKLYGYSFSASYAKLIVKYSILLIFSIVLALCVKTVISWIFGGILTVLTFYFAYKDLNKRIQIKDFIISFLHRNS